MSLEPKICIIGTGFAGICAGFKMIEAGFDKLDIYETNKEVGGTWLVNRYPGCASDVPSHLYSFSFAPKADWSKHYSSQPEIHQYLKDVTKKAGLYSHILFETRVEELQWDTRSSKWIAVVHELRSGLKNTIQYDIVVNGSGLLRIPNYPDEFCNFKGHLIHSAEWDPTVKLCGKRVGVVGTGASAIQIIPAIVSEVDKLTLFQRRPPYIVPRLQFEYPHIAKWALKNVPGLRWATRNTIFWMHELAYFGFRYNTFGAKIAEITCSGYRRTQIFVNEKLRKEMTPHYEFGCKRILPSNGFYSALQKPNVNLISGNILQVIDNAILTDDGAWTELDVLILATGYKPHDYFAPLTIIGENGISILDEWKTLGPRTYLGTMSRSLPNYFILLGPHTVLAHSSVIFMIECQVNWMIKVLKEMKKRTTSYVSVKPEAESNFMEFYHNGHKKTVWGNSNCASWYLDSKGKIDTLYPHNLISFWRLTKNIDLGALDFQQQNRCMAT